MRTNTKLFQHYCRLVLMCIGLLIMGRAAAQPIDFGKSYVNVSKGNNGGTIETGDTLEIRAAFVVKQNIYDSCAFFDVVPTGTTFIPGTIRVLTNEGKIYKQFTDAITDDEGYRNGNNIRINLGYNQTQSPSRWFRRGRIANNHRPSFYNNTCIMVASYRVRVTAAMGTIINTGGGYTTYKLGTNPLQTYTFVQNRVAIYSNYGICSNSIGTNSLGTEFNGTFGSGKNRNRGASANVPPSYSYMTFTNNSPQDYYYGIPNNTSISTGYTTSNAWPKPDNARRVFGVWDIIGDHTGAADPVAGNTAADTVANNNGGYMLVINASYRIDSAFQQTISNLCPNTYYEISCWVRNICSRCGCDSAGRGASSAGYIATAAGDSSGVYPNLTFEVDGIDYFTTGNIRYTGQWVKKGFTFLTGPNQTSFTLKFFNNAPGGGGNDWALDDISVATCGPNLQFTPSPNPDVCRGNAVDLGCYVRSYFNNYGAYKWQKSTTNGATWVDYTPPQTATPSFTGSGYEYFTGLPSFVANAADSGSRFRVVVATTVTTLQATDCAFADSSTTATLTLNVIDCRIPLSTSFLNFEATQKDGMTNIKWKTDKEESAMLYFVEKSTDGINFYSVATINGHNQPQNETNSYTWTTTAENSTVFYRVRLKTSTTTKLTKIIALGNGPRQFVLKVPNPFNQSIAAELVSPEKTDAVVTLIDAQGRTIRKQSVSVNAGSNSINVSNVQGLSKGMYVLSIQTKDQNLTKRLMKE